MLTLLANKWARIGSGLGLLLLLAAQDKLCPWLAVPVIEPARSADTACPPVSDDDASSDQPKKLLPHLLPDATAPRWPAAWRQVDQRRTTHVCDGIVVRGARRPSAVVGGQFATDVGDPWAWHCFVLLMDHTTEVQELVPAESPRDPALRTSICPTGPPRA